MWLAVTATVAVVGLVGLGTSSGWFGLAPGPASLGGCPTGVTLAGAGASFLSALVTNWQSEFHTTTANLVNYNPSGAGAGIVALAERTVDFAATDEPLNATEAASLPGATLTLPISGGAVAVVYHIQGYSGPLNLSAAQLAGIYLGHYTAWNAPGLTVDNPGLPAQPVITVHRSDGAGTTYVLTNYLSNGNATWNQTVGITIQPSAWPATAGGQAAEHGNSLLAAYVASTPNTIGYVDLADAVSHGVAVAAIENPSLQYVAPNVTNTQSAIDDLAGRAFPPATGDWAAVSWIDAPGSGDYPLATLSYFLVLQNPGLGYQPSLEKTTVLVEWLRWAVNVGQAAAAALYYVTPPPGLLAEDLAALSSVNYNGMTPPTCA